MIKPEQLDLLENKISFSGDTVLIDPHKKVGSVSLDVLERILNFVDAEDIQSVMNEFSIPEEIQTEIEYLTPEQVNQYEEEFVEAERRWRQRCNRITVRMNNDIEAARSVTEEEVEVTRQELHEQRMAMNDNDFMRSIGVLEGEHSFINSADENALRNENYDEYYRYLGISQARHDLYFSGDLTLMGNDGHLPDSYIEPIDHEIEDHFHYQGELQDGRSQRMAVMKETLSHEEYLLSEEVEALLIETDRYYDFVEEEVNTHRHLTMFLGESGDRHLQQVAERREFRANEDIERAEARARRDQALNESENSPE
jgi:hypothetical protein